MAHIAINTWHFIAARRIGAVVTTYLNGVVNTATPGTLGLDWQMDTVN